MKPLICWAIVSKDGRTIDASSVSHTRRSAIAKWSDMVQPWKYWRDKRGWRAAKVTISLADEAHDRDAQMRADGRVAGLREGYLLGFMESGEIYNAEYPFRAMDINPESDDEWCKHRDEAIMAALSAREGDDGKGE